MEANPESRSFQEYKISRKPLMSPNPPSHPMMDSHNISTTTNQGDGESDSTEKDRFTTSGTESPEATENWIDDRSALRRWTTDWWLLELLSTLMSLAASMALIGVLLKYDGRALPSWPSYITLNSLLALFTTIAKAGLILPITQALGQLKWIWFAQKERPLTDFQTFDESSRGMTGSFKLLYVLRFQHLACLGAVISILGLGTSFITQQMISYPTRSIHTPSNSSTALRSDLYWAYLQPKQISPIVDLSMRGAVQGGVFSTINGSVPTISPTCSSGNCTWDSFSSLGVCFKAANVTNKLQAEYLHTQKISPNVTVIMGSNITLPNGAWLEGGTYNPFNLSTPFVGSASGTLAFSDIPNIKDVVIANSFMIYSTEKTGGFLDQTVDLFSAIEIILYWCVNTHSALVIEGVPSTNTTESSTYVRSTNASYTTSGTVTDFRPDGREVIYNNLNMSTNAQDNSNYTVEGQSKKILAEGVAASLSGYLVVTPFEATTNAAEVMNYALWDYGNASFQQARDFQMQVVSNFTSNIAASMTNNIRGRAFRGTPATGIAQTSESYVKVRWAWLAYLLCLFALSVVFLTATMIKSSYSQVNILKSSALAAMAGFSAASQGNLRRAELRGRIWEKAKKVKVRLVRNEKGWEMQRNE